jgi:HlyD family secretion protein
VAQRPKTRRNLVIGLAAVAVVALALMFAPRPLPVDAARVSRGPIAETVYDQGQARVRDAYVAAAPVAGRLQRISLKVGDPVAVGQAVAQIAPAAPTLLDPSTLAQRQAAVSKAEADLAHAQAEASRTALVAQRTQPLVATGAASRQSLDDARTAADQARESARSATAALAQARAALIGPSAAPGAAASVFSPASGYVTKVLEPSARDVAAGAPLIEISDPKGLEAVIEFLSQDAARIRAGMAAEVYDWGGPDVLAAQVRRVEPEAFTKVSALGVEEQRVLVWLTLTDPPAKWTGLAPGYRVWGRVFLRREPAALTVPLGALERQGGAWAVLRIEGGRARLRSIKVGAMTDKDAEVLGGLSEGDQVVVFPSDAVRDGVRVAARN